MQAQSSVEQKQKEPSGAIAQWPLLIRGREFTADDFDVIVRCIRKHFDAGRTYISLAVCKELDWKQPNGWFKDRACRDVLLQLERDGRIALPPRKTAREAADGETKPKASIPNFLSDFDLTAPVMTLTGQISLEFAKGNKAEPIWNALVKDYHYLGHTIIVGRCIKYLVKMGDTLLGAVAFSSPAWELAARNTFLASLGIEKSRIPDVVINNSRFLILPHVQVPNLASRVLSLATSRVVVDWAQYYSVTPQVAETFVESSRYAGVCYRAANWVDIGSTKGYAKRGKNHHNSQEPKRIFLYGLNRHTRRRITQAYVMSKRAPTAGA